MHAAVLHRRNRMSDNATELHETSALWGRVSNLSEPHRHVANVPHDRYMIRIPPAPVVERRWRVKVRGVVTPSPVGVAMLKLR